MSNFSQLFIYKRKIRKLWWKVIRMESFAIELKGVTILWDLKWPKLRKFKDVQFSYLGQKR